ncbi:Ent-kaurene synthase, partial [Aspergillus heteromorphus CBS 117.55]
MTLSVYDTAWVSLVAKEGEWLFPECFQVVLRSQSPGGGFGVNEEAPLQQLDGILSTMAALLALCKHQKSPSPSIRDGPHQECTPPPSSSDLQDCIDRAQAYLNQALQCWDVRSTVQVGFEILVPSLLRLLHEQGLHFDFPGRNALMKLHRRKMEKIQSALDTPHPSQTTLLHSLESFIGSVDLGKMAPCLVNGSMMGSPSSTAAYLIHSPDWDEEAERYLRFVVARNNGRVPSAFPISVFELSWVLSTLLSSGFQATALGMENVSTLANYIESRLAENDGITGFAPGMLADADDTAKSIYSLRLLGRRTNCEAMLQAFEGPTHFKTYNLEAKESFSVNCNVLIALLASQDPSRHLTQISKALRFLCSAWENGKWSDKWNIEAQYAMMLLADALATLIERWHDGTLGRDLDPNLLADHVPLVTLQILVRTLSAQSTDSGSWKQSPEITAYGLLTLKALASLPWLRAAVGPQVIDERIDRAIEYLRVHQDRWNNPEVIWVEKVNYGSSILSETYCLAALQRKTTNPSRWGEPVTNLCKVSEKRLDQLCQFLSRLPIFKSEPRWRLQASILEGDLLAPALRRAAVELAVFPFPQGDRKEGKTATYLEYIPLTWTTSNNAAASYGLSTSTMVEMMVLSLLNFQVDKWLEETTEDPRLRGDWAALKTLANPAEPSIPAAAQINTLVDEEEDEKATFLAEAHRTLRRFVQGVLQNIFVRKAPPALRRRVRQELHIFLLAHVTQGENNDSHTTTTMTRTYYDWVRTTSADHTSCPYSFEFFRCLVSSSVGKEDCFAGPRAQYLAQDVCRHLATMCRQYNDYGSIARDREEHNLNSVDFLVINNDTEEGDEKTLLLEIAKYERECLELAVKRLQPQVSKSVWKAWEVFLVVTDLYGQIYVARDINSK